MAQRLAEICRDICVKIDAPLRDERQESRRRHHLRHGRHAKRLVQRNTPPAPMHQRQSLYAPSHDLTTPRDEACRQHPWHGLQQRGAAIEQGAEQLLAEAAPRPHQLAPSKNAKASSRRRASLYASTCPPCAASPPRQSHTPPPAPARIGISAWMSNGFN